MQQTTRLCKYLSHLGVCSRRNASRLIEQQRVTVNGRIANHIDHVSEHDLIAVDGEAISNTITQRYYAYNKPVGVDCKLISSDPNSLVHHLPVGGHIYPVGRLDKDSRGLLILTNDGALCNQLTHPDFTHEKEYLVTTKRPLEADFCAKMAAGVPVGKTVTLPCVCTQVAANQFRIVLTQGLNRQIRKMAKYHGHLVTDLYRIRIGALTLNADTLEVGQWQELEPEKVNKLLNRA